jgi:Glyoxalase-like domain
VRLAHGPAAIRSPDERAFVLCFVQLCPPSGDAGDEHGPITWIFQREAEGTPPARRLTPDLTDDEDWRAEVERVQNIGAQLVGEFEAGGARWAELTDPEENHFRVFAPRAD